MPWASVAYILMSKCQDNFEIIIGNMPSEAENHFTVSKINSSPGYFKFYLHGIVENRHTEFCSETFPASWIDSHNVMAWHIV